MLLGLVLLVAAVFSGWSVWKHRPAATPCKTADARSDYVLQDFDVVALDKQGQESFTLRSAAARARPRRPHDDHRHAGVPCSGRAREGPGAHARGGLGRAREDAAG